MHDIAGVAGKLQPRAAGTHVHPQRRAARAVVGGAHQRQEAARLQVPGQRLLVPRAFELDAQACRRACRR
ncbi:MAG: hypothetical protein U1F25_14875 [Rubrivivax sp.]